MLCNTYIITQAKYAVHSCQSLYKLIGSTNQIFQNTLLTQILAHTLPLSLTFQLLVSSVPAEPGRGFAAGAAAAQGDCAPLQNWVLKS